jgi:hypothetical protein
MGVESARLGHHVQADPAMNKARILAIMQNQWFRDPERAKQSMDRLEKVHGPRARRRFIYHALFAGSLSGKRLLNAFGADMVARMDWEECSREISGHSSFRPTPDQEHIKKAILDADPHIIITFGAIAFDATKPLFAGLVIRSTHPAARGHAARNHLETAAKKLRFHVQLLDDTSNAIARDRK